MTVEMFSRFQRLDKETLERIRLFLREGAGVAFLKVVQEVADERKDAIVHAALATSQDVHAVVMDKGFLLGLDWILDIPIQIDEALEDKSQKSVIAEGI